MVLPKQNIYLSLKGNVTAAQINSTCGGLNRIIYVVAVEKFSDRQFLHDLKVSCSLWVMDMESYSWLLEHSSFDKIGEIPELLVLVADSVPQDMIFDALPANVSFFGFAHAKELFHVQLQQALKRALKNSMNVLEHERYNSFFINSVQPSLIYNHSTGEIVDANYAAAKLYEKEPDQLTGVNISVVHPGSFELIAENMKQIQAGENIILKNPYIDALGQMKEFQYKLSPICLAGKRLVMIFIDDVTDKGQAYELFYQQAQMLRNTLESIDDLLFSLNREGDFIEYYQPSGGGQLTLSSDVFVGKNIYDVGFPYDVAQKYLSTIEQVIDEDKPEQIDYFIEAFGSKLWYNAKISPRKNVLGIVDGVTVLCRDVTRQKKTEETLKVARDFYLTLLSDFPSMIWKTNSTRKADYFNNTWLEFTGRDLGQEVKTEWVDKIHLNDISRFLSVIMKAYTSKESFQIEHRLKHRSGEYRWVINAGRPFYNMNGKFEGFIGSCYDITERRKAEEMMLLQKSAMESALEGIMIIEDDNKNYPVIYANKELSVLTDTPVKEILGKSFIDILGCPVSTSIEASLLVALRRKESFRGEYMCVTPKSNGASKWYLLFLAPVKEKIERSNHFVAVLSDITEAKLVETQLREKNEQLIKTNEELDSFVYSTSHELRSPLMSVLGVLNLVEPDVVDKDQMGYLAMIRESIARLDKIIHDIIDYSRNSRLDIDHEKIDFKSIVDSVIENHRYYENFEKVSFLVDVQETSTFLSDPKRIHTIINSFVSNSLWFHDYAKEKPFIRIQVRTSEVSAVITIHDNGTGIHEKHMPRIYDMFYRGTEKSKGSGIGLYIVKEIVAKLGGQIIVNSDHEKGTTFSVELPNFIHKNYKMVSLSNQTI
jgi:PAS domain S-box-containing protein